MEMRIAIQDGPIDVAKLRSNRPEKGTCGGYATFEGIVRRENDGKLVSRLDYECYEPLARQEIGRIVQAAKGRYAFEFAEVVHRVGALKVGDIAVFIQVYSPHRREAFLGCMTIIDELKQSVPIWKKEYYQDGTIAWPHCDGCAQHSHP